MIKYISLIFMSTILFCNATWATSKNDVIYKKELWYGFTLKQTEDYTYFLYGKTEISKYDNSGIVMWWSDICKETITKYWRDWDTYSPQEVKKIKKTCNQEGLRIYYQPKIIKTENTRFYIIRWQGYEGIGFDLFDTKTRVSISLWWPDEFTDMKDYIKMGFQYGKNGIYFFNNSNAKWGGCQKTQVYLIKNNGVLIPQGDTCNKNPPAGVRIESHIGIESIELQKNNRIKINYIIRDEQENILGKKSAVVLVKTK